MSNKITPAFIPHDKFHKGIWLLSVKRPGWYYFLEKENPNSIRNSHFRESVDAPLKELVDFLHNNGFRTTPSCAGHDKKKSEFSTIYEQLEEDARDIQRTGLKLKDVETGELFMFRKKNYALPWDRQTFISTALAYQSNGVLGIRAPQKHRRRLLGLRVPNLRIEEKDGVILLHTHEKGEEHISSAWKKITQEIISLFRKDRLPVRGTHERHSSVALQLQDKKQAAAVKESQQ